MKKKNIIAKQAIGYDTEYMFRTMKGIPMCCPFCRSRLEVIPDLNYIMRKRKGDMYYTYDCICLVSEKFRQFCDLNNYPNLKFIKLKKCNWYYFQPLGIFKTDIHKNKLGTWCPNCNNYEFICGQTYKDKNFNLPSDDFILGTDTAYGSNETRTINVIIGLRTMKKMKDFGLKGLYYNNVYDYED